MDRRVPKDVSQILRRETNFGCPVDGCGVPYLEYHHFNPRWSEKQHHNPEGMIALCGVHHPLADGGMFNRDQLEGMKKNPYISDKRIQFKRWYISLSSP